MHRPASELDEQLLQVRLVLRDGARRREQLAKPER